MHRTWISTSDTYIPRSRCEPPFVFPSEFSYLHFEEPLANHWNHLSQSFCDNITDCYHVSSRTLDDDRAIHYPDYRIHNHLIAYGYH